MLKIRIFAGDREVGELSLTNGCLTGQPHDVNSVGDQNIMEGVMEPYIAALDGNPVIFDADDDPVSFLFNLRKHLRSGQGINVSNVEGEPE